MIISMMRLQHLVFIYSCSGLNMAKRDNCVIPDGDKLRQKRLERGFTQETLSFVAKVSKSSIERVEKSKPTQITTLKLIAEAIGGVDIKEVLAGSDKGLEKNVIFNESQKYYDGNTLIKNAKALNISLNELLGTNNDIRYDSVIDFESLTEKFREIDHRLLPLIRDHQNASKQLIEYNYKSLLRHCFNEQDIQLKFIDRTLKDPVNRNAFLADLPEPGLTVDISSDFNEISYSYNENKTLTVKSPELLWDCHCDTPSTNPNKFKCPIHSKSIGEEIDRRFSTCYVVPYFPNKCVQKSKDLLV